MWSGHFSRQSGSKAKGSQRRHASKQAFLEQAVPVDLNLRISHLDLLTMTHLDIKLKLANTAATLILVGSHGFSFQDW